MVAQDEWEPKHPQLTIKPRAEKIAVRDARTQGEDAAVAIVFDITRDAI
jgi:hypothetical protein